MNYAFRYRLPGTTQILDGCSTYCMEQPQGHGFLIAPFIPHSPMMFIPKEQECSAENFRKAFVRNGDGVTFAFPVKSTEKEAHRSEIEEIIKLERTGELTKAVAARCLVSDMRMDIDTMFQTLCQGYPNAFVFLFTTPESGTWIGATPELLLENKEGVMRTMALAGTRPAGTAGEWDMKNIREQGVVTDYIKSCFRRNDLDIRTDGPHTVQAGPVEHLRTEIKCLAPDAIDVLSLIDDLAPTPAVCGMPRELAADTIARCERFERGYYGGFCGPWTGTDRFSLYVILRCARVTPDALCLFAGGGIMPDSDPEAEWIETEAKLSTLKTHLLNMNR